MTQPPPKTPPRRPVRMCVECGVLTDDPVLVAEVHQGTGPGFNVYACRGCAPSTRPHADCQCPLPPSEA
ncbi:hypothetical protein H9Y04_35650 [Streptomyces sp. TRM66268-LWL]|uniref:Uncharacterized protein n=1 Tax=Streptomyces polyasparticus TaxID=2767826 RepID=A0ABR7SSW7_9ACTN|nr:hypothetical protein [Streptomyces polyasparticus]MBC9717879.1 hypothetical protein [Streptomyces polyasparticus]